MKSENYILTKIGLMLFALLFAVTLSSVKAEDLRVIKKLEGRWRFETGNDANWSRPDYDDSHWDRIDVPERWEKQGFRGHDGYAWYRKTFEIRSIPEKMTLYLLLGRIDDADEVFLNGVSIGTTGKFPPELETAHRNIRKYVIPKGLLKIGEENIIAVKVFDEMQEGGIVSGPIGIYYDEDEYFLAQNLEGEWLLTDEDNSDWRNPDFKPEGGKTVLVPAKWEAQGFNNYDGVAWYRKEFVLNKRLRGEKLYLAVGVIDDDDRTYLNGEFIGNVHDVKMKDYRYRRPGDEWKVMRIYEIPEGLLKNGRNVISIRVYDEVDEGGIISGPVGLMNAKEYENYYKKYSWRESEFHTIWDLFDRDRW